METEIRIIKSLIKKISLNFDSILNKTTNLSMKMTATVKKTDDNELLILLEADGYNSESEEMIIESLSEIVVVMDEAPDKKTITDKCLPLVQSEIFEKLNNIFDCMGISEFKL